MKTFKIKSEIQVGDPTLIAKKFAITASKEGRNYKIAGTMFYSTGIDSMTVDATEVGVDGVVDLYTTFNEKEIEAIEHQIWTAPPAN